MQDEGGSHIRGQQRRRPYEEQVSDWRAVQAAQGRGLQSLHYPAWGIDREGRGERLEDWRVED